MWSLRQLRNCHCLYFFFSLLFLSLLLLANASSVDRRWWRWWRSNTMTMIKTQRRERKIPSKKRKWHSVIREERRIFLCLTVDLRHLIELNDLRVCSKTMKLVLWLRKGRHHHRHRQVTTGRTFDSIWSLC